MTALHLAHDTTATGPGSVTTVRAAIAPVLSELAQNARAAEEHRQYPFDAVKSLAAAGIGLLGVARADGGIGGSIRDVVEVVISIARADSNVAQALRPTFLTANQVSNRDRDRHREITLQRLRDGALFAGTGNERNGGASGSVSTTAEEVPGGYRVTGRKYYSTGGLYASYFSTQARTADGEIVRFTVPTDRQGVIRHDDFDAVGQRLTQSGSTELVDVWVADDEASIVGNDVPDNPWGGSFAQLYLAAVQAGIAHRALDDAVAYVREHARPIKHSSASSSDEDPYVRETVGQIAAHAQAARAVVVLGAETLEGLKGRSGSDLRAAGAAASVEVAQAGVVAIEATLRATELLFDVGGGSITDRSIGYDRHWRNARTAANHNPRQWKAAVAGAYHLSGTEPPTSGLF